jgi:hypothetical protein
MPKQVAFPSLSRAAATYNSPTFKLDEDCSLAAYVAATAGAGTVVVKIQESDDQGTTWIDSVATGTISNGQAIKISLKGPITGVVRVNAVVSTAALTFGVTLRYTGAL